MSDKVLTKDSSVSCSHSGSEAFTSTAKLKAAGKSVLLKADVLAGTISGCTFTPPPPTRTPCTAATSVTAGEATKLKVGGLAVILDTLQGATNSSTPGTLTGVSAGQTKLKAA